MQLSTILTKLAAGTVAGVLTVGTGWAFAEVVEEEPPAEAPAEDPVVEDPIVEEPVTEPVVDEPVTEPVTEPVVQEPVVEEPVTEPVVQEPVVEPVVEEDPVEEEPVVHVRKENHGKHVSEAAHTAPKGPGHGAAVSEVATSDVGKKK